MKGPAKNDKRPFTALIGMSLVVLLMWIGSVIIMLAAAPDWGTRGTMGDSFGAINALFSGLAFAALIYTIILQREEIKLNRNEIELNRKELRKSVTAQQNSQEALREQVQQTHLTAKINAMSTVINYYNIQIANPQNPAEVIEKARAKRRALIQQIDILIEGLQDSDIE